MKSDQFTAMGMAAMLPGMQYMLEQMQAILIKFREELSLAQEGGPHISPHGKRLGRPPKEEAAMVRALAQAKQEAYLEEPSKFNSWAKLSPAEREERSRRLSDAQRAVRGLPPRSRKETLLEAQARQKREYRARQKTGANGQALLATGWPADPEERKKEMKRRMAKWKVSPAEVRRRQVAAAKKMNSGGKSYWAKLTPAQRTVEMQRRNKVAKANREART